MTKLFTTAGELVKLNQGSLLDPKVKVVNADAAQWLETAKEVYDAVIIDFPDPTNFALGKLYSVPFYRLLDRHLSQQGLAVVQSTSPYFAPNAYWTVDATLRDVGFKTAPYHTYVPSFGEWGFIIASRAGYRPPEKYAVPTRFLDASTTRLMFDFPADMPKLEMEPNQLNNQSLVHAFEKDWRKVIR
jgi:spermidine synthase